MSCYVIIPARADSKGIIDKNIQPLAGKPLIAHNIVAAKAAGNVDRVIVSTDGESIASAAQEYGADIIWRPPEIARDLSSSESAILHALDELDKEGTLPEYVCFSQCTSPLTATEDFDKAIEMIKTGGFDCVFSATDFHYFIWKEDDKGCAHGVNHDETKQRLMRQERDPEYIEAGAFYIFRTDNFKQYKSRFFGKIGLYKMPSSRVFEIDTIDDLKRAGILMEGCA